MVVKGDMRKFHGAERALAQHCSKLDAALVHHQHAVSFQLLKNLLL
jgi:hypothetical protein